jgi:signal transduction histidine kinase
MLSFGVIFIVARLGCISIETELIFWSIVETFTKIVYGMMQFSYAGKYLQMELKESSDAQTKLRAENESLTAHKHLITRYLYNESHVPLNTVMGGIRKLLARHRDESAQQFLPSGSGEQVVEPPPDSTESILETMLCSVKSMYTLCEDSRSLDRVRTGTFGVKRHPCRLQADVLEPAIDAFTAQAREKGVELNVQLNLGTVRVVTDAGRLLQIVSNLLSNAIDYSPPQGRLTVKADIVPPHAASICHVIIQISDGGPGLREEIQAALRRPFSQRQIHDKVVVGTTGIGLNITRGICETLGGQLQVIASSSHGTTFFLSFRFPVALTRGSIHEPLTSATHHNISTLTPYPTVAIDRTEPCCHTIATGATEACQSPAQ